jgi:glycosyltransferase involved in cell wall biosynthesis
VHILFLHDNFPAQFGVFGRYLIERGWEVTFGTQRKGAALDGMRVFNYAPHREPTQKIHPYVGGFEKAVLAGQGLARAALKLKEAGLSPDIVMAHSGWGPGLFVQDIWPDAAYIAYFEWYYRAEAPDIKFMGGARTLDDDLRSRTRNAQILMDLANCDAGICPTQFQKSQFPEVFHDKLIVMHDGIDTDTYQPAPGAKLDLPDTDLSGAKEIITYVARGMEPYRGFPEFMKALEIVLAQRPDAHAVILGEDRVAYGKKLPEGDSFKKRALAECDLDWSRVHFTGLLPRNLYLQVLQASSVHVYLTVPFVLSWSMMEAMSTGCAIVSSDVDSVTEMAGGDNPTLMQVDHRNPGAVAAAVKMLLSDRERAKVLGEAARAFIVKDFSAQDVYRRKEEWIRKAANRAKAS